MKFYGSESDVDSRTNTAKPATPGVPSKLVKIHRTKRQIVDATPTSSPGSPEPFRCKSTGIEDSLTSNVQLAYEQK